MKSLSQHILFVLVILGVTCSTFFYSLQNRFVGDDEVKIVKSNFYESWDNADLLYKKDYLSDSEQYFLDRNIFFDSGEVSYRPATSLFYFLDRSLWGLNPFGYHLLSLVVHVLNAVMVYCIVYLIIGESHLAFWSALLFAVHPTRVESVCAISYRHDLLATCFGLLSFLSYLGFYRAKSGKGASLITMSYVFFFFAIFAKESWIIYPLLIMAYDFLLRGNKIRLVVSGLRGRYLGFFFVSVIHAFFYFGIFRNTTLGENLLMGGSWGTHIFSILWIFVQYVKDLALPFFVKVIPPLHSPDISSLFWAKGLAAACVFLGFLYIAAKSYHRSKPATFFLIWFLLGLLPVSNIIPLANPMAHRFLYFPAIGFFVAFMICLEKVCRWVAERVRFSHFSFAFKSGFIVYCMIHTFSLSLIWKDNVVMAKYLSHHYPNDSKANTLMAIQHFRKGQYGKAEEFLKRSIRLGSHDPRVFYMLGHVHYSTPELAVKYFEKTIDIAPEYVSAYVDLAELLYYQGKYDRARFYLRNGIKIRPTLKAYVYLIKSFLVEDRRKQAKQYFDEALSIWSEGKNRDVLDQIWNDEGGDQ